MSRKEEVIITIIVGLGYGQGMGRRPIKNKLMLERLGLLLRELRVRTGLSQADFGEQFDLHERTISKYERGKTAPGFDILAELIEKHGLDLTSAFSSNPDKRLGERVPDYAKGPAGPSIPEIDTFQKLLQEATPALRQSMLGALRGIIALLQEQTEASAIDR